MVISTGELGFGDVGTASTVAIEAGVTERSDSRRKFTPGSFFYVEM
jgi:hypothetical protein